MENNTVDIIGAGLAGTEAALQLAQRVIAVRLFEMRPLVQTDVHRSGNAEARAVLPRIEPYLVCE